MGDGIWTGERYIPEMGTLGDFADRAGIAAGVAIAVLGWIATLVMVAPVALKLMSRGKPCDSEKI